MDQITAIEDAIIARLKELLQAPGLSCDVLPYPDRDFEAYEPMHRNGEILVGYRDEDDGPTQTTDLVVQDREMFFELTFVFSSLRPVGKVGGIYAHIEAVRLILTGFRPESCTKKTILDGIERVKRYKKRWWQYTQTWKFTALNIEIPPEGQEPLLKRITLIGDTTNETTEVPEQ